MKRCCPGAGWVILAALWLAASESQPPGCRDCALPWGQRVPVRLQRHITKPRCPLGMNWVEAVRQCCTQCPAGESCLASTARLWHAGTVALHSHARCHPIAPTGKFLSTPCSSSGNDTVCTSCPAGTFLTQPNTLTECQACYECDHQTFQTVLTNCSATSNVVCGCETGHFRQCHNSACSEFSCQQCEPCAGRLVQRPCSEAQDTVCGDCKPNFYAEGSECRPCHTSIPETCGKECQRVCGVTGDQGSGLEYILLALTGPLFLGALGIYHKRKRLRHSTPAGSPLTPISGSVATPQCQVSAQGGDSQFWTQPHSPPALEHASGVARQSPECEALLRGQPGELEPSAPPEPRSALMQGSQLYAVIDAVPVRRWKEFMRVLELREADIELVELEVAHIRDQQYEMLKRWCQQTSATLDRIFAALERMELAGCAEALRRSLSMGP
ncbi:tumor necrosis factor receptor superfamily member 25 [Pezoporus wallicus]|uniref:tumor necrosis factor receptor superfamily member 25 n=1 Tax=Pezoporus wallicus TaxID=35540 RepID=UPI00254DB4B3|nr:tumor necrosis factor receptor superfamily member 25 [Pezoporus wallicus]